ncbi:death-associated protein kinase 2 isoform X2 [Cynoglossus semilaevis]|uniref:non-specific serine/threonine protein kinase n=1 Tax=Cynoglossus semilaevis TaxID=244447 RepID=A0A3P8WWH0_CYNSE|nr:death-associated protein kinase 2-like isoform X1 [Cynoglossus semilaevis]XP_008330014.1 death-associated protein kinase 2-like isoform X1 [Cynoglossus semilaevis]XP_024920985.1 death-associated protein kinase 2-like isoform X1 [Cynoglossus semilaevis]XP_024920986.1 death-associated protein kinase 2-like isoform X2 [Cynoglossus semilaevis]
MAVFKPENVEDFYEIGEILGSGHFGQVRLVCERSSRTNYAGKFVKIRKSACSRLGQDRGSLEREVEILHLLQHPNIIFLKDVFECRAELVLILEFVSGGELFDFIAEKEVLLESEAITFMKQILEGLRFMHGKNIAHFDLKPENIMLSDKSAPNPTIKLIDFGLAHRFLPDEEYKCSSGTPQYLAPEVINSEPLTTAADMWSIGVITYILISGLSPFQGDNDDETLLNVLATKYEFYDQYFSNTSSMAKGFIDRLLVKDSNERMTAEDCLHHPWIKPITRKQMARRNRSSINMKSFKRFNARRKWKMSYNMVRMCNRLFQACKGRSDSDSLQRQCESDVEDTETKPASLLRRRLSSSS